MIKRFEDMTEPELRAAMISMADGVQAGADFAGLDKPLFVLLVFNDPKLGQYISNCKRADMITVLRETADRLERKEDVPR